MSAQTTERVQHWLLKNDPFATEAYTNLRRGEIIGSRFSALSDAFPAHFATFLGPYHPASDFKLHIIIPNKQAGIPNNDSTIMYGFFEGTAQCFAITIPNKRMPEFLEAARASLMQHRDPDVQRYDFLSNRYQIEGVEPKEFLEALGKKFAHQPMLMGEQMHAAYDTIELFKLNQSSAQVPFFGPEESAY